MSGELLSIRSLGASPGRRTAASTREPGDLPRPCRVCGRGVPGERANGKGKTLAGIRTLSRIPTSSAGTAKRPMSNSSIPRVGNFGQHVVDSGDSARRSMERSKAMKKPYIGVRLRRLREERGMTQASLAAALDLSTSYLNQLERNQRPLTVPVLLRINAVFGVDVQFFSEDQEARLLLDLRDALSETHSEPPVSQAEIRELASGMPAVGRAFVSLYRRHREAIERGEAMAALLGDDRPAVRLAPMPFEEVRDFFYNRHNYIEELDLAAEELHRTLGRTGPVDGALSDYLSERHGMRIVTDPSIDATGTTRQYDPTNKVLHLSARLRPSQRAFQMATQLAFHELGPLLEELVDSAAFSARETASLARIGLANYFAGALILPYRHFLEAAEADGYDIERLGRRFGVGYETVCHRLSTLQRADARGVPFFFIRVDRAGNISKRQSATDFHFSRVGGSCPLWNVYEAFSSPGRILTQRAQMPDGRTYLWIARTVHRSPGAFGLPGKVFSIGLGCDIRHAEKLVYAKGLDLADPASATPIGAGCKVCERQSCPQRAFPPITLPLAIDENRSQFAPYSAGPAAADRRSAGRRGPLRPSIVDPDR